MKYSQNKRCMKQIWIHTPSQQFQRWRTTVTYNTHLTSLLCRFIHYLYVWADTTSCTPFHPSNPFCTLLTNVPLKIYIRSPWPKNLQYIMNQTFNSLLLCLFSTPNKRALLQSVQPQGSSRDQVIVDSAFANYPFHLNAPPPFFICLKSY